jgi:ribosomal-protein-serine acetyltransferase
MKFTYRVDDEVVLRLIEPHHADELFAVIDANRSVIRPWMRWVDEVTDVAAIRPTIGKWIIQTAETGCVSLGIELGGALVGAVFHVRPDVTNDQVEIGYWLAESARGRGVALRAVRAFIDITIRDLGFNRINIRIAPGNRPSLALAERLGLEPEGVSRQAWKVGDAYYDATEFGVLADEWRPQAPPFALTCEIGEGLDLCLLEPRHADAMFALVDRNRAHLSPWMAWCTPDCTAADTEAFIRNSLRGLSQGRGAALGIRRQGRSVGAIGNEDVDLDKRCTDIGYWLDELAQGQSLVTRAVRAVIDYSLIDMGLDRVTIHTATSNARSRSVPERVGFRCVGTKPHDNDTGDPGLDPVEYELLAADWGVIKS